MVANLVGLGPDPEKRTTKAMHHLRGETVSTYSSVTIHNVQSRVVAVEDLGA